MSPIAGKIKLVTIRFKLFFLFERMNCLITHMFTKEKAVKAPIFTREVATSRLNTKAGNASKRTKIILNTGEFSLGCKETKIFLGITSSLLISYINREGL